MFRSKILFVLGAGSSKEVGLPTGDGLKEEIQKKLSFRFDDWGSRLEEGDHNIFEQLRRHVQSTGEKDPNPYVRSARVLTKALPMSISIDNVIEAHNHDVNAEIMGKVAIVSSILDYEKRSKLFVDRQSGKETVNMGGLNQSWFNSFFKMLHENVNKSGVNTIFDNVSFVNFNYDRCLEQYLFFALKDYYNLDQQEAENLVRQLTILRPYGSVGDWSATKIRSENIVAYGEEQSDLFKLSKRIKTFSEKLEESDDLLKIRKSIAAAEIIVFLGFAFHRQNLDLIKPTDNCVQKQVFGTAIGISDNDSSVLKNELHMFFNQKVTRENIYLQNRLECSKLMSEFWRSLTTRI